MSRQQQQQLPFLAPEETKPLTELQKQLIRNTFRAFRGDSERVAQEHGINVALVDAVVLRVGYIRRDGIKLC